jgi:O-antigen ligase
MGTPHNLLLEQLLATGVIGLVAFVWIIVRLYARLLAVLATKIPQSHKTLLAALLAAVTGYLVQAQFIPDVLVSIVFFWVFIALGIATANCTEKACPLNKEFDVYLSVASRSISAQERDIVKPIARSEKHIVC